MRQQRQTVADELVLHDLLDKMGVEYIRLLMIHLNKYLTSFPIVCEIVLG